MELFEEKGPEQPTREPAYYSTMPHQVLYDNLLSPGARMLYCGIVSLTTWKGYAWVLNKTIAASFNVTTRTVMNWIAELENRGYIKNESHRRDDFTTERRLYLLEGRVKPVSENSENNFTHNNITNNISIKEKENINTKE